MLTEAEVEEIRKGLRQGLRGPIIVKWIEALLADRDDRRALERAQPRPWPGPLAGPCLGNRPAARARRPRPARASLDRGLAGRSWPVCSRTWARKMPKPLYT
jgi:hypothetical protein